MYRYLPASIGLIRYAPAMQSNLRPFREQAGLRQIDLIRKTGLGDKTVRNVEKGRPAAPATLYKLLNALNALAETQYSITDVFPDLTE
jgi:transcriptional regulator with XRE-family HTH domain